MNLTVESILEIYTALSNLKATSLTGAPIYRTAQNLVKLEVLAKAYNEKRDKLIEEFSGESKLGTEHPRFEEFANAHRQELQQKVDLDLYVIKVPEEKLNEVLPNPQLLAILLREKLIEVVEEAEKK